MNLRSFVSATLSEIHNGISDAQNRPGGGTVAAEAFIQNHSNLLNGGTSGIFTVVDFDVSVAAGSVDGGNSVRVAGVESIERSKTASSNLSRVKFSVHLRIPQGEAVKEHPSESYIASDDDPMQGF